MKRFLLLSTFMLAIVSLYAQDGVKKDVTLQLTAENIGSESSLSTALSEAISGETSEVNLILTFDNDVSALSADATGWLKELLKRETTVTGIDMSAIGAYAILQGNTNVKDVKLPDLADKNIPENMFRDCSNLETLTIGMWKNTAENGACAVRNIGNNAFRECAKLTNLNLEVSGTVGDDVFRKCSSLTDISVKPTAGNKDLKFGSYVFGECDGLVNVEIPEGIIGIGENAFAGCANLENIKLSSTVKEITYSCISQCENFKNFTVSEDNTYFMAIDGNIYSKDKTNLVLCPWTKNITNDYEWPDELAEIGANAFRTCTGLGDVVFKSGLKNIGDHAFAESSITSITLPSSVTGINGTFLYDCKNLKAINIDGTDGNFISVGGILYNKTGNENGVDNFTLFSCPAALDFTSEKIGILPTEKYDRNSKNIASKTELTEKVLDLFNVESELKGNLKKIEAGAFYKNKTIEALALPDNIESIGDQAFNDCSIKYITVPYKLKQSGYGVAIMVLCTNFEAYVVDNRCNDGAVEAGKDEWTKVGDITYYPLDEFSVGNRGVLYDKAYEVMYSVPAQYVPANDEGVLKTYDNIRMIHSCCFRNTQNIEKVILSQGIMAVPHQCFYNSKVKSIVIPNSVVQLGQDMFQKCSELKDVYFLTTSTIVPMSQNNNYNIFWDYNPTGGATFHFSKGYDGLVEAYQEAGDEAGNGFKSLKDKVTFQSDIDHRALFEDDESIIGFNNSEEIVNERKFNGVNAVPNGYSVENIRNSGWNENNLDGNTKYQYITLYRDFASTQKEEFNTLALPFSITRTQMREKFEMLNSSEEAEVYKFVGRKDNTICFETINLHQGDDNEIVAEAGEAVLIKPTRKRHSYQFELEENTNFLGISDEYVTSEERLKPKVTEGNNAYDENGNLVENVTFRHGFYATFRPNVEVGPYFYYVTAAGKVMYATKLRTITKAFRGYIFGNESESLVSVSAAKMNIDIDGIVTGIDEIKIAGVTPVAAGDIYSIDGRLVRKNAASADGLPKGMYVVNGKKIAVR